MNKSTKKEFILEELCCANCANKIEGRVGKINGVTQSCVNFVSKTLTVETDKDACEEEVILEIKSIVKEIEPDVKVRLENKGKLGNEDQLEREKNKYKRELIRLVVGAVIFGIAIVFEFPLWIEFILYLDLVCYAAFNKRRKC